MWLTKLKIAIVEKNTDRLSELMDSIPKLESEKEMTEALYLIKEAEQIVSILRDDASKSMKQIKQNLTFLKVTEAQKSSKLDIKS
jgi:dsDNA-binding SOS-regulon protein